MSFWAPASVTQMFVPGGASSGSWSIRSATTAANSTPAAVAQATGFQHHVPIYEANLREEEKTYSTFLNMTDQITVKFLQLSAAGEQAKR